MIKKHTKPNGHYVAKLTYMSDSSSLSCPVKSVKPILLSPTEYTESSLDPQFLTTLLVQEDGVMAISSSRNESVRNDTREEN